MLGSPQKLDDLQSAVLKAGDLALEFFRKPLKIETKSDGSQVSNADLAVNELLQNQLMQLDPNIAWLSEESPEDPRRKTAERLWIIDPIDGTSSYIKGEKDWTIVAALVENNQPILAAVYNPIREELFLSEKGKGATFNNNKIATNNQSSLNASHIITSKSHFKRTFSDHKETPTFAWRCSMAYRIALVASGKVDATISLTPKSDWDIAAAHLILDEAGGKMTTPDGKEISYNTTNLRHSGVVAASRTLHTQLVEKTTKARPAQTK